MKVICTNIGPKELGGQLEWEGSAVNYNEVVDQTIKTAFDEDGTPRNREEDGHIFVYELDDQDRRDLAHKQIVKYYPEWKQMNILRSNVQTDIEKMGVFIDACREWSNDSSNTDPFTIQDIIP